MNFYSYGQNPQISGVNSHQIFQNAAGQYLVQQPQYFIVYQQSYVPSHNAAAVLNDFHSLNNINPSMNAMKQLSAIPTQEQQIAGNQNCLASPFPFMPSSAQMSMQGSQLFQTDFDTISPQYFHLNQPQIQGSEFMIHSEQPNSVSTQILLENQISQKNCQLDKNSPTSIISQTPKCKNSQLHAVISSVAQQSSILSSHLPDFENLEEFDAFEEIQHDSSREFSKRQLLPLDQLKINLISEVNQNQNSKSRKQVNSSTQSYIRQIHQNEQMEVSQNNISISPSQLSQSSIQCESAQMNQEDFSRAYSQQVGKASKTVSSNQRRQQPKTYECKIRKIQSGSEQLIQIEKHNNYKSINSSSLTYIEDTHTPNQSFCNNLTTSNANAKTLERIKVQSISSQIFSKPEKNNYRQSYEHSNSQTKLVNQLIQGLPCPENKILKKFKLADALKIIKNSIYNKKKEMIFEQKSQLPFKLKQSSEKNDEIVFAQIKESRRNNRSMNKGVTRNSDFDNKEDNQKINNSELEERTCSSSSISDNQNNKTNTPIDNNNNNDNTNNDNHSSFSPALSKKQNQKIQKVTSKFHNLKKLFMYKLVATFNVSNMMNLGVPEHVRESILKMIVKFKLSAKKSEEFNRKTEFFSQAHYNALFLYLNPQTICTLAKNKFEVHLHKLIFSIDLEKIASYIQSSKSQSPSTNQSSKNCQYDRMDIENEECNDCFGNSSECCYEEKIQYINILKRYCYQIVKSSNMFGIASQSKEENSVTNQQQHQQQQQFDLQDKQLNEQENMRMAYTFRALEGITSLSKGIFVKKF